MVIDILRSARISLNHATRNVGGWEGYREEREGTSLSVGGGFVVKKFLGIFQNIASANSIDVTQADKKTDVVPVKTQAEKKQASDDLARVLWGEAATTQPNLITVSPEMINPQLLTPEHFQQQISILQQEKSSLQSRIDELEQKIAEAFAIVLITPESVTFRNGYTYLIGDLIDFGPFNGKRVKNIDDKKRRVYLDDEKTILRMSY